MQNRIVFWLAFVVIIALPCFGCAKKPAAKDDVLANVSNSYITVSEFKSKIAKMPAYYQDIAQKNKQRYLDDMIAERLFYEEAVRKGLERDKDVVDILKEAKKKVVIAKFIKMEVEDKIRVPEDEMRQFYEAHKAEFKTPPLWRASHILVSTETDAADVLDALSKGAKFDELAKARSTDATASRGGDIGYFKQGQLVPGFEKECLRLNVGETSGIVHTQFGYHIITLTDKKEPGVETYEKVRGLIESQLKKKRRGECFDTLLNDLRKRYRVEVNEDVMKKLEAPTGEKEVVSNE